VRFSYLTNSVPHHGRTETLTEPSTRNPTRFRCRRAPSSPSHPPVEDAVQELDASTLFTSADSATPPTTNKVGDLFLCSGALYYNFSGH
jgi:hypothetical protein